MGEPSAETRIIKFNRKFHSVTTKNMELLTFVVPTDYALAIDLYKDTIDAREQRRGNMERS